MGCERSTVTLMILGCDQTYSACCKWTSRLPNERSNGTEVRRWALFAIACTLLWSLAGQAQEFSGAHPLVSYAPEMTNYQKAVSKDAVAQLNNDLIKGRLS